MPKVLTRLKIDEISAVDHAANGGARITLFKRDGATKKGSDMADRFVEVCKKLGDGDPSIIVPSERELTEHIMKYAGAHRLPGESQVAAFNRLYNEQTDEGLVLRKAIAATKRAAGFPV
jgi:hypothetical protein